jgi:PAS domain S-box-containing protein
MGATVRRYRRVVNSSADTALEAIVRSANDAIVTVDAAGRVLLWNPYAERLFGYSSSEMTGQLLTAIIPERYRERHRDNFQRVAVGGDPHVIGKTVEHTALHRDGSEFPIELSRALWDVDGERFFVGIIRDITERKEAEAEIRRVNDTLAEANARSEELLLNVLPEAIAAQLKEHAGTIADRYESISILFADIVGFTPMSLELTPEETVDLLNQYFTYFDELVDRLGVEKIRTIGDNYMAAAGVPTPRPDHAAVLAEMAIAIRDYVKDAPPVNGHRLDFRIGINSGPVVAGVIGTKKFQYDIWGDAVNTASRMESHGVPGRIQISEATRNLIGDEFICTPRGEIDIKGKGPMKTWFLEDPVG